MKSLRRMTQFPSDISEEACRDMAIQLLAKSEKSRIELDFLMQAFSHLKFFQDYQQKLSCQIYLHLFRAIQHCHLEQKDTVFDYGDEGTTFYILLQGTVVVLVPKPQLLQDLQDEEFTLYDLILKQAELKKRYQFDDFDSFVSTVYSQFVSVRTLKAGDCFGEISLLTKQNRTATIVCSTDVDFIVLQKHDFDRILGEQLNLEHKAKLVFFKEIPYFQFVPEAHISILINQMIEIQPKLNDIIYKENEIPHSFYFILEGEVELSYLVKNGRRIVISLLSKGGVFGEGEILSEMSRKMKAISKSNETVLMTLSNHQFTTVLQTYQMLEDCRKQSIETTNRRLGQLLLRRKATDQLLVWSPPFKKMEKKQLDPEITRFQSFRSTNAQKREYKPLTSTDCLVPIDIPKFIKLKEMGRTQQVSSYAYSPRQKSSMLQLKQYLTKGLTTMNLAQKEWETSRLTNLESRTLSSYQLQLPNPPLSVRVKKTQSINIHMIQLRNRKKYHKYTF